LCSDVIEVVLKSIQCT